MGLSAFNRLRERRAAEQAAALAAEIAAKIVAETAETEKKRKGVKKDDAGTADQV